MDKEKPYDSYILSTNLPPLVWVPCNHPGAQTLHDFNQMMKKIMQNKKSLVDRLIELNEQNLWVLRSDERSIVAIWEQDLEAFGFKLHANSPVRLLFRYMKQGSLTPVGSIRIARSRALRKLKNRCNPPTNSVIIFDQNKVDEHRM